MRGFTAEKSDVVNLQGSFVKPKIEQLILHILVTSYFFNHSFFNILQYKVSRLLLFVINV